MKRLLIPVACVLFLLALGLGSLLPAGARLLPWYAPQPTHVLVYAIFALGVRLALRRSRRPVLWTLFVVGGIGLLLELAQIFVPARQFTLPDAALNLVGTVLGVMIFEGIKAVGRAGNSEKDDGENGRVAPASRADSLAHRLSALSDDRLLAAWPLLLRHGHISPEAAALAEGIQRAKRSLGNPPAGDRLVLQALEDAGVRCLLLKGTLLAHTVYDSPDQRERGDTDLLVAPEDRVDAEKALQRIGMARGWQVTAKTSDTQDQWQGRVDGHTVILDLHWQLLNHPAFSDLFEFQNLWARRIRADVDGYGAVGLGRQDALLHAVLHYFAHHGDEFRPAQWLLDMDLLWRAMDDGDREQLVKRAGELGISGLVVEAMRRTQERFGTPIAPEMLDGLTESGKHQWRTGLLKVKSGPLSDQIFKLRAIRGWRPRLGHLRALLFPSREYMRKKYPGAARWSLPWLYVRRMIGGRRR